MKRGRKRREKKYISLHTFLLLSYAKCGPPELVSLADCHSRMKAAVC